MGVQARPLAVGATGSAEEAGPLADDAGPPTDDDVAADKSDDSVGTSTATYTTGTYALGVRAPRPLDPGTEARYKSNAIG